MRIYAVSLAFRFCFKTLASGPALDIISRHENTNLSHNRCCSPRVVFCSVIVCHVRWRRWRWRRRYGQQRREGGGGRTGPPTFGGGKTTQNPGRGGWCFFVSHLRKKKL